MSRIRILTPEQKARRLELQRKRRREAVKVPTPPAYDYDKVYKLILNLVETQGVVSSSEVRYRIDSFKHDGKKIGMRIIYGICDDLVMAGKIAKVKEGRFVKFKRVSPGVLDQMFGMVVADVVSPARIFSVEDLHDKLKHTPKARGSSHSGIRSTFGDAYGWEAAW